MHIRAGYLWTALALFMFAVPVWAHTDTAQLSLTKKAEIGTTQLKPGDYTLEVNNNKTMIKVVNQNGNTVAEVPCHTVQINNKPTTNQVIMNGNQVTEIDFRGNTEAVRMSRG
jgi:hypothetical protein